MKDQVAPEIDASSKSIRKDEDDAEVEMTASDSFATPGPKDEAKVHRSKADKVRVLELFRYATLGEKFLLCLGCISSAVFGLCQPVSMVINGRLIDAYGTLSTSDASRLSLYYVYLALVVIVSGSVLNISFTIAANRISARVQTLFFQAVLKHDVTYFDMHGSSAGLTSISSANIALFKAAIGLKLGLSVQTCAQMLGAFLIGFFFVWQLSLLILGFCPFLVLGAYVFGTASAKDAEEQVKAYGTSGAIIEEALGSIRTVTALSAQRHFIERLRSSLVDVTQKGRRAGIFMGLGIGLLLFTYQVCFAPSYYVGAVLVVNSRNSAFESHPPPVPLAYPNCSVGQLVPDECNTQPDAHDLRFATNVDVCNCALCRCGCFSPDATFNSDRCVTGGDVLLVFFCIILAGFAAGLFIPNLQSIALGQTAIADIFALIEEAKAIDKRTPQGKVLDVVALKGEIKFEDAVFAYPSRPDVDVLQGTNLTIPAGKRIAICGASGSGKSSIVSLVLRFYDLKSGKLTLDGVDVTELDTDSLRSCIGLVSQEPVLFAGVTIKENVRYGKPSATDDEVEAACKMANAHDFIMQFPSTYDTVLVGSSLSGGQKQRIAIARALIRDPRVLILDEASAALDSESERLVNEAIDQVVQNTKRTVIVVAHRLSTIRTCERIVMMGPGGRVIEEGTHEDLMSNKGAYYNMTVAGEKTEWKQSQASTETTPETSGNSDLKQSIERPETEHSGSSFPRNQIRLGTKSDEEIVIAAEKHSVSFYRLFSRFAYPERYYLLLAIVVCCIAGAVDPFLALTFSRIIPAMYFVNNGDVLSAASLYAWIFFGLGCVKGIVNVLCFWAFAIVNAEMTARVRIETFSHLLRMEMAFFDERKHSVGALTEKLARDAALIKASVGDYSSLVATVSFGLVIGLIIAFLASWKLTLVVFALFPMMGLGFAVDYMFRSGGAFQKQDSGQASAAQTFSEALNGFRTVQAFDLGKHLVLLYRDQLTRASLLDRRIIVLHGICYGLGQSIQYFAFAIMFTYAAQLLNSGEISFQDILQSLLAIVFTANNAGGAFATAPDIAKGKAAVQSIFSLLNRPSKIDPFDHKGLKPSAVMGDLNFENVAFAYPSRKECPVLQDFSFNVPRGTILALVGESGSGKSTIIQLLERFYDADHGRVLLDGNTTDELNVMWLRSRIGLVSQEPVLFDDTIYNNIKYGLGPDAAGKSEAEITAMIETAAKEFGQKQRIAISRALVRDPDVLLCDEATSALDEESQRTVQDALDRLLEAKKRTVIIIAHRLTTVQRADVILVLRKGEVVETGSYDELAEREGGHFRALLLAQSAIQSKS